jgi:hypothetical protein
VCVRVWFGVTCGGLCAFVRGCSACSSA